MTTPPPYTVEELSATVGPAAIAWAQTPSAPTYDALASSAMAVLSSGRPLPQGAESLLAQLSTYPGSDVQVLAIFDQLGPALPPIPRDAFTTTTPPPLRPAVDLGTDPRFDTCGDAKAAGYGPYRSGEPEYSWYRDADSDGVVCE